MAPMNLPEPDLKAIFCEALDLAAGPERLAYLDEVCRGDATLRLQVESLLKAHDEAGGFLGSGAAPTPVAEATSDRTPEPEINPPLACAGRPSLKGRAA
jgi:hypothetical protein